MVTWSLHHTDLFGPCKVYQIRYLSSPKTYFAVPEKNWKNWQMPFFILLWGIMVWLLWFIVHNVLASWAFARYDHHDIAVRLRISFISTQRACRRPGKRDKKEETAKWDRLNWPINDAIGPGVKLYIAKWYQFKLSEKIPPMAMRSSAERYHRYAEKLRAKETADEMMLN